MPPTTIHTPPPLDSFTPLADHQSHTPASFYGAKPVLHYHAVAARAVTSRNHVSKLPVFPQSADPEAGSSAAEASAGDTLSHEGPKDTTVTEVVDAFINSE